MVKVIESIDLESKKVLETEDYAFDCLKRSDFKELAKKDEDVRIMGATFLRKVKEDKDCDKLVCPAWCCTKTEQVPGLFKLNEVTNKRGKRYKLVHGYACVGNKQYVVLRRRWMGVLLYFFILFGILGTAVLTSGADVWDEEGVVIVNDVPVMQEQGEQASIAVPALPEQFLTSTRRTVRLVNPEDNDVYFQYDVTTADGDVVFQTKNIAPGMMVEADLYELLPAGQNEITLRISTYDVETHISCNGTVQTVLVSVDK